jgi:hypothetical protein
MATKGVIIDPRKPLQMLNGTKITKIGNYREAGFEAYFIDEFCNEDSRSYDREGFYIGFENDENYHRHLIYVDDTQQSIKTKKRKIVQLVSEGEGLAALCNDGSVFYNERRAGGKWFKLREIPQD